MLPEGELENRKREDWELKPPSLLCSSQVPAGPTAPAAGRSRKDALRGAPSLPVAAEPGQHMLLWDPSSPASASSWVRTGPCFAVATVSCMNLRILPTEHLGQHQIDPALLLRAFLLNM